MSATLQSPPLSSYGAVGQCAAALDHEPAAAMRLAGVKLSRARRGVESPASLRFVASRCIAYVWRADARLGAGLIQGATWERSLRSLLASCAIAERVKALVGILVRRVFLRCTEAATAAISSFLDSCETVRVHEDAFRLQLCGSVRLGQKFKLPQQLPVSL